MLEEITNISFIFAVLAFIGFLLLDAYNSSKYLAIPNTKKSALEVIFHYCSISVLVIGIFIGLTYPLIKDSIPDPNAKMIYEIIFNLSFFYIIAYFIASIFGLYMRYFSYNFVYATYEQDGMQVTEKFPSVLIIDDDFIYFEKNEMNCWKSIPKPKISLMETKKEKNTRFRELLISKHPWVVENDKKIKCLLFLALIVYFVTFAANIFSPILPALAAIVAIVCVILIS